MGDLLELGFYNPLRLPETDFVRGFVARQGLFEKILTRLEDARPKGVVQHRLILGQRGMGKTSLLRRIAIGVRDSPRLNPVLLPLTFREEQYNVHNLRAFWCNCLDALGDWFESQKQSARVRQLDQELEELSRREDDEEGSMTRELFRSWIKTTGRRPLLLLDNIDLILEGLKKKEWSLRRVLQEPDGVVVIGASSNYLESTARQGEAFYDFFQVDVLNPLGPDELVSCLRSLAAERGEQGKTVLRVLNLDPGRIRALYDLSGGNPRTLAMLYLILEADDDDGDLMNDLERLLDQATPLYKARVEELAPQARVVLDAVALAWNPITAAEVAEATTLEIGHVSAQLDRLQKDGIVEKASVSTTPRAGYQVSERFFNIWYLMRHAPRRPRSRLRWLTEFLRALYSPPQLAKLATGSFSRGRRDPLFRGSYRLALSDAVDSPYLRAMLRESAREDFQKYSKESGVSLESLVDGSELPEPGTSTTWLLRAWALRNSGLWSAAEAAYHRAIELDPGSALPWNGLGNLLQDHLARYEEAEAAYRRAIELDPKYAYAWFNLGILLKAHLARYQEAEVAYRRSIELDPKCADAWHNLGNLLQDHLARYEEAEAAYRTAIELDPKDAYPWNNLGNLLQTHVARYEEAEAAYRTAIELDPQNAYPWSGLGNLLQAHLARYEEAEVAYRRSIELDPKNANAWNDLGNLLQTHLARYEEAEAAYRRSIELDPNSAYPWNGLGSLLQDHLGRPEEAVVAYRKSLEIDPTFVAAEANLAYLFLALNRHGDDVDALIERAIRALPGHGANLLRAFRALAGGNLPVAIQEIGEALDSGPGELLSVYLEDLLRVFHFACKRGFGDRVLAWLDESGLKDRYWPLWAALDAHLHGEKRLWDVSSEVRGAARRIYDWLDSASARPPGIAGPGQPGPKAGSGRKSRKSRTPS